MDPKADVKRSAEATAVDIAVRLGFVGLFAWLSLRIVVPFASLLVWAAVLTVALYPIHAWLTRRLGGRRVPAAVLLTFAALVTVAVPAGALMASLVRSLAIVLKHLETSGLSILPPAWIADIPVIGSTLSEGWAKVAGNLEGFAKEFGPFLVDAGGWLVGVVGSLAGSVLFIVIAILLTGVLMVTGAPLVRILRQFADRVIGARGAEFVDIAGATIRNVARGIIGVSLLQSLLTGVGLLLAGVPAAGLLTLAALFLSIIQIGAWPVVYPAIIWAWLELDITTAVLLTLYMLPIGVIDNVLKPLVMSQGLKTPMLVILFGVLGGTFAYGLIGLFLGPVILAVFYELLVLWIKADPPPA
jgi:predicted PurR-regulated permease PerM